MKRYPFQPLMERIGARSLNDAGVRLGVSGTTLYKYRGEGLSAGVADRLAVGAGLHPAMVWPEWVDDGLSVVDRLFLESGWRQAWLWREAGAA